MFGRKKSVESITAKLHDTVEELKRHAGEQHGHGNRKREEAERLKLEATAHHTEMDLALTVAGNIAKLLGQ